jgi:hypothetical protein
MPAPSATTVKCTTCGTEFSSSDTAELQNHQGHTLEHIEQA